MNNQSSCIWTPANGNRLVENMQEILGKGDAEKVRVHWMELICVRTTIVRLPAFPLAPHLKVMDLVGDSLPVKTSYRWTISGSSVSSIVECAPNLKTLRLCSTNRAQKALDSIEQGLLSLEHLTLILGPLQQQGKTRTLQFRPPATLKGLEIANYHDCNMVVALLATPLETTTCFGNVKVQEMKYPS